LANIKNKKATPLYEHFQPYVCGTEHNIQIQILETVPPGPDDLNQMIE